MASNEEAEELMKLLQSEGIGVGGLEGKLKQLVESLKDFKAGEGESEDEIAKKLMEGLASLRPQPNYKQYFLFIAVVLLLVSIFGERNPERKIKIPCPPTSSTNLFLWISITNEMFFFFF